MKLSKEELNQIQAKLGVDTLYSWSRIDKFISSPYEYFLKYVLRAKEDNTNSVYPIMGGICHSILEKFYNGEIKYEDMEDYFVDAWTNAIDISGLKFDRCDGEKNEKIGDRYYENLKEFFLHHKPLEKERVKNEQFVTIKTGTSYLQGYIDVIYKEPKTTPKTSKEESDEKPKESKQIYRIIDWKTSTKYSGKKVEELSGQLVLYALALIQKGIPKENIKICWNFLKYVTVKYHDSKGNEKYRDIERRELGEKLQSNAKMWLKKLGYSLQVDYYLKRLIDTNDINCLPDEVKDMFEVDDCYVYIPLSDKLIEKWTNLVIATIKDIELREKDYSETGNEMIFFDSEEQVKANSYYFANLCGYSAELHKPYNEYLKTLEESDSAFGNTFKGVGGNTTTTSAKDDDLAWLDELK